MHFSFCSTRTAFITSNNNTGWFCSYSFIPLSVCLPALEQCVCECVNVSNAMFSR